jgi:predicted DCC family thiol-disulfide oxidoreductase YuxK
MCNHVTRIILSLDHRQIFRFAPLHGETFLSVIPPEKQEKIPDSIVVLTEKDRILVRTDAVIFIGKRLGGLPRIVALFLALIPRLIRDGIYRGVAAIRYRVFGKTAEQCSIIPPSYRQRLLP